MQKSARLAATRPICYTSTRNSVAPETLFDCLLFGEFNFISKPLRHKTKCVARASREEQFRRGCGSSVLGVAGLQIEWDAKLSAELSRTNLTLLFYFPFLRVRISPASWLIHMHSLIQFRLSRFLRHQHLRACMQLEKKLQRKAQFHLSLANCCGIFRRRKAFQEPPPAACSYFLSACSWHWMGVSF